MKTFWRKGGKQNKPAPRYDLAWRLWCDEVTKQVRFWPDHEAIRLELMEHLEDGCADLERLGYDTKLAKERSLRAMGDAKVVGTAMDQAHKPWLGWLWQVSRGLVLVLIAAAAAVAWFWNGGRLLMERLTGEILWEPPAYADYAAVEHAEIWMAPGEITWEEGKYQAEILIWSKTDSLMDCSPMALHYVEVTDDRGTVPERIWRQTYQTYGWVGYNTSLGLTRHQSVIQMRLDHRPAWVEITYPYGSSSWTLRAEWEAAP